MNAKSETIVVAGGARTAIGHLSRARWGRNAPAGGKPRGRVPRAGPPPAHRDEILRSAAPAARLRSG